MIRFATDTDTGSYIGSAKNLLIHTPMKGKIGGTETELQKNDKFIHTEVGL